jgi:cation diffusion facilitator family transporter
MRAASIAGAVYLAFAVAKLLLGGLLGSVAVEADGVHTMADSLTALAVYVGLRLARGRPSSRFPFGKYKAENLAALVVAVAIGAAAVEIARDSIHPPAVAMRDPWLLAAVELASAAVYYALASYMRRSRGSIFSSLSAEATHAFQDVLISAVVVVGVAGQFLGATWISSAVGLGIAAFILYQAYGIGKSSILTLLDAADERAASRIERVVSGIPGVVGVHEVRTRRAGPFLLATMHLETSPAISVRDADALADRVEDVLRREMPDLLMVSIHEEPGRPSGRWRVAVFEDQSGYVADHAADSERILIVDTAGGGEEEIPNPARGRPMRDLIPALRERGVDAVIVGGSGGERLMALRAAGMVIYRSPRVPARDAVELFRRGALGTGEDEAGVPGVDR